MIPPPTPDTAVLTGAQERALATTIRAGLDLFPPITPGR